LTWYFNAVRIVSNGAGVKTILERRGHQIIVDQRRYFVELFCGQFGYPPRTLSGAFIDFENHAFLLPLTDAV